LMFLLFQDATIDIRKSRQLVWERLVEILLLWQFVIIQLCQTCVRFDGEFWFIPFHDSSSHISSTQFILGKVCLKMCSNPWLNMPTSGLNTQSWYLGQFLSEVICDPPVEHEYEMWIGHNAEPQQCLCSMIILLLFQFDLMNWDGKERTGVWVVEISIRD
jgi:hypothetical protein